MSFRVQFTITDQELKALETIANQEGFPNVAELCKTRALAGIPRRDDGALYKEMVKKIEELPEGAEFFVRDLIDTPPSILGRWLYDNVANDKIKNVEHLGKKGMDPEKYIKIKKQ